jgi:hypothetical protein
LRQPAHRRQFDLLRLALRATQIFEVNERSAIDAGSDAHQPHAQQPLRRLHLERGGGSAKSSCHRRQ